MESSPLYEHIGGAPALAAAIDEFYRRVLADPSLAPLFAGTDLDRLKAHQRAFFAMALRGPNAYAGRAMHAAHAGRGITERHFDRVARHMADTFATLGAPGHPTAEILEGVAPLLPEIADRPSAEEVAAA